MDSEKKTGAHLLVEVLHNEGVECIFGYPGGSIIPIFDVLPSSPVRFILTRHEQGATHMADGYARATGKPGVVLVTSGPGATNTVTGIMTAHMDSVPMVVITGQAPKKSLGLDSFQEADMLGIQLSDCQALVPDYRPERHPPHYAGSAVYCEIGTAGTGFN